MLRVCLFFSSLNALGSSQRAIVYLSRWVEVRTWKLTFHHPYELFRESSQFFVEAAPAICFILPLFYEPFTELRLHDGIFEFCFLLLAKKVSPVYDKYNLFAWCENKNVTYVNVNTTPAISSRRFLSRHRGEITSQSSRLRKHSIDKSDQRDTFKVPHYLLLRLYNENIGSW